MLALAMHYGKGLLSARQIAESQNISRRYLDSILKILKNARLINAERGQRGGYALQQPPTEIQLHDVLSALEDELDIVHCTKNGRSCGRSGYCCTQEVWNRIRHTVEGVLWQISLADLVERQRELDAKRTRRAGADCAMDAITNFEIRRKPGSSK